MKEVQALFRKASRSFEAARILLANGDADFAASRAYYGYFYVATALLFHKGLSFSRHGQVIAQYGLHFAKTEELPPRYHQAMIQSFSLRQVGDYGTASDLNASEIRSLIEEGDVFLKAARDYLDREDARGGEEPDNG